MTAPTYARWSRLKKPAFRICLEDGAWFLTHDSSDARIGPVTLDELAALARAIEKERAVGE